MMLKRFKPDTTFKKNNGVKLNTLRGRCFAIAGAGWLLLSMAFIYKGCLEHVEIDFILSGLGVLSIVTSVDSILVSTKLDDRLIKDL